VSIRIMHTKLGRETRWSLRGRRFVRYTGILLGALAETALPIANQPVLVSRVTPKRVVS